MDIIRHIGKIANTDQKCVVAFMQIPDAEDFALVIPTDNLQPMLEQAVQDRVMSQEGQQAETLAVVLGRYKMPDTGQSIMEALHNQGKLVKVPVHNILMLPKPNQPVKLSFILENWPGGSRLKGAHNHQQQHVNNAWENDKFNPHQHNQHANTTENSRMAASNLIIEAEMLEADAMRKRNEAYKRDPSLRPQTMGASQMSSFPAIQPISTRDDTMRTSMYDPYTAAIGKAPTAESIQVLNPGRGMQANPMEERMANLEKTLGMLADAVTRMAPPVEVPVQEAATEVEAG